MMGSMCLIQSNPKEPIGLNVSLSIQAIHPHTDLSTHTTTDRQARARVRSCVRGVRR